MGRSNRFQKIPGDIKVPKKVVIAGVGGVGSWLTLFLGQLMDESCYLDLYDPDEVEYSNLSRTPFMEWMVGMNKAYAMRFLLEMQNPMVDVKVHDYALTSRIMRSYYDDSWIVIDTTDALYSYGEYVGGIDGKHVYFKFPAKGSIIFGEEGMRVEYSDYGVYNTPVVLLALLYLEHIVRWRGKKKALIRFNIENLMRLGFEPPAPPKNGEGSE